MSFGVSGTYIAASAQVKDNVITAAKLDVGVGNQGFYFILLPSYITGVAGTWAWSADGAVTNWIADSAKAAGYIMNGVGTANNNEFTSTQNVYLSAGTYVAELTFTKDPSCGIMEVLHGADSFGTVDGYAAGTTRNQSGSVTLIKATGGTAKIRLKVTGKNGASSNYYVFLQSLRITRTA